MKFFKRYIFLTLLFFVFALQNAVSQSFTAALSKSKVALGEPFRITFSLSASGNGFQPPTFSNFNIVAGPSQSNSMQIVNGNVTQSLSFSYTLTPTKEGTFTIGSATINAGGKKIESNTVTVEVIKGSSRQGTTSQQQPQNSQNTQSAQGSENDLFLKADISKSKVFLGEQLLVSFKIFTRLTIVNIADSKAPTFNGFWSQDIKTDDNVQMETEYVDGVPYNVAVIKKYLIFPQRTGSLVIDPFNLECIVRRRAQKRGNSIFDQFFGSVEDVSYKIQSKPVRLQVEELPDKGKPDDFTGAVGDYTMQTTIDKQRLKANDAATLKIIIAGSGNLKLLDNPKLEFPPDMEVYDPRVTDNTVINESGMRGSKTFEYLIIPRSEGNFTIPSSSFSFFNPRKKEYVTLEIPSFDFEVERDLTSGSTGSQGTRSQSDIKNLKEDIRFIHETTEFKDPGKFFGSELFYTLLILPFMILFSVLGFRKFREHQQRDPLAYKSRTAASRAFAGLKIASEVKSSDLKGYYSKISSTIYSYLEDKLAISKGSLSRETISSELSKKGYSDGLIKLCIQVLDTCDMARYSPVSSYESEHLLLNSREIINTMENRSKGKTLTTGFLAVIISLISFSSIHATPEKTFEQANLYYKEKKFDQAAVIYDSLINDGHQSPELLYNAGNAYFKLQDFASAILHYERSLRLDPDDADVLHNLSFANRQIPDKMERKGRFVFDEWFNTLVSSKSPDEWAYTAIGAFFIGCFLIIGYVFITGWKMKRMTIILSVMFLIYGGYALAMGKLQYENLYDSDEAIVFSSSVTVNSAPVEDSEKIFVIHSGLKVKIKETSGQWARIQLMNGNDGWIRTENIRRI